MGDGVAEIAGADSVSTAMVPLSEGGGVSAIAVFDDSLSGVLVEYCVTVTAVFAGVGAIFAFLQARGIFCLGLDMVTKSNVVMKWDEVLM